MLQGESPATAGERHVAVRRRPLSLILLEIVMSVYHGFMGDVSRTELNQQTARVLARVASGERITITDRGRSIAEIVPVQESPWERLVAAGKVRQATHSGPLTVEPVRSDVTAGEILADIRRERG